MKKCGVAMHMCVSEIVMCKMVWNTDHELCYGAGLENLRVCQEVKYFILRAW